MIKNVGTRNVNIFFRRNQIIDTAIFFSLPLPADFCRSNFLIGFPCKKSFFFSLCLRLRRYKSSREFKREERDILFPAKRKHFAGHSTPEERNGQVKKNEAFVKVFLIFLRCRMLSIVRHGPHKYPGSLNCTATSGRLHGRLVLSHEERRDRYLDTCKKEISAP